MSLSSGSKLAPTGSSMEFAPKQKQGSIRLRDALLSRGVSNSGRRLLFGLGVAMKWANARLLLGLCFLLTFFLQITVFGQGASAQTAEKVPLPQYYGTYAVSGGKLYKFEEESGHALVEVKTGKLPTTLVQARLGTDGPGRRSLFSSVCPSDDNRNTAAIESAAAVLARSEDVPVPALSAEARFLVFFQPSGPMSPMMIARGLKLGAMAYVRNVGVSCVYGVHRWNVPVRAVKNSWGWAIRRAVTMNVKPVPGQQEMVVAVPQSRLESGLYVLSGGALHGGFVFAVTPLSAEAERAECSDVTKLFFGSVEVGEETTPCGTITSVPQPSQPSNPSTTVPQPSAPVAVTCSEYNSCVTSGRAALRSSRWNDALAAFQKASGLGPSKPEVWDLLGTTYSSMGRDQEARAMWDKALQAGGISFYACRERFSSCDTGSLRLTTGEVSFTDEKKEQKVFSAPPSGVTVIWAGTAEFGARPEAVIVRVANKNYRLYFRACDSASAISQVRCPEAGRSLVSVREYVAETIPKLASGSFTTRADATAKPSCTGSIDLGYSLRAEDGHVWRVKGVGSPGPTQVHVFLDETGALVRDPPSLLQKLTLGAWTKERIVDRYNPSAGSTGVKVALYTFGTLHGWQYAEDLLARATVETIAAVLTMGASVDTMQTRLVWGVVEREFTDPKAALAHWVRAGLEQSLADYTQMEGLMRNLGPTEFKLSDLGQIASLYTKANTLASVNEALGASLAPTTWQDEFTQYLRSAVSELVPQPGLKTNALLTLSDVLKLEQYVAGAGQVFAAYKQSLELALKVSQSNQQVISAWAADAARGCQ